MADRVYREGHALLERGRRLEALLEKPGREILGTFAAVYCDGCGAILRAETVDELAALTSAAGWRIVPPGAIGPDLCGHCQ